MSAPTKPQIDYSYEGFQAEQQDFPFPGTQLDNDLAELKRGVDDTIDALADVRRADGALQNGIVTRDSLAADVVPVGEGMNPDAYDPNGVEGDVFDMANMVEAADAKILTAAERALIGTALQPDDVGTTAGTVAAGDDSRITGAAQVSVYDPTGVEADAFDSANHVYDNTTSGLTAETTQDAIDEIDAAAVRYRFKDVADMLASTKAGSGVGARWQAGPYLYDEAASDTTDHHVETAGGVHLFIRMPTIDVAAANITPDEADNSAQMEKIVRFAIESGSKLTIDRPGRYAFLSSVEAFSQRKDFWLVGNGGVELDFSNCTDENYFRVSGLAQNQESWVLGAALNAGDEVITLASPINVLDGDILIPISTEIFHPARDSYTKRELLLVRGDQTTDTIDIWPAKDSYGTGTTQGFIHVQPMRSLVAERVRMIGPGPNVRDGSGLSFEYACKAIYNLCEAHGITGRGLVAFRSLYGLMSGCHAQDCGFSTVSGQTSLGYGLYMGGVDSGGWERCTGRGNRHTVEVAAMSRNLVIENCDSEGDEAASFSSHGNTDAISFVGNRSRHSGGGITARGKRSRVRENDILNGVGTTPAINLGEKPTASVGGVIGGTDAGGIDAVVTDNRIVDYFYALNCGVSVDRSRVSMNTCTGIRSRVLNFASDTTEDTGVANGCYQVSDFEISGNVMIGDPAWAGTYPNPTAIRLTMTGTLDDIIDGLDIDGNTIRDFVGGSSDAVWLQNGGVSNSRIKFTNNGVYNVSRSAFRPVISAMRADYLVFVGNHTDKVGSTYLINGLDATSMIAPTTVNIGTFGSHI